MSEDPQDSAVVSTNNSIDDLISDLLLHILVSRSPTDRVAAVLSERIDTILVHKVACVLLQKTKHEIDISGRMLLCLQLVGNDRVFQA